VPLGLRRALWSRDRGCMFPVAPASPRQNAYAERLIGSIRRELLDHVVVLDDRHLRRLLKTYLAYYNQWCTHRSLDGDAPESRSVHQAQPARTAELPAVHGLHHYYLPGAACIFGTHR
jgi:transposase InsO family protein